MQSMLYHSSALLSNSWAAVVTSNLTGNSCESDCGHHISNGDDNITKCEHSTETGCWILLFEYSHLFIIECKFRLMIRRVMRVRLSMMERARTTQVRTAQVSRTPVSSYTSTSCSRIVKPGGATTTGPGPPRCPPGSPSS